MADVVFCRMYVNQTDKLNPSRVHRGASHRSCGYLSMLGPFPGCEFTRPQHDSILPLLLFGGKQVWRKKTTIKNNHSTQNKQHVVEASASLSFSENHGNINFDMQIPLPFVQCSTKGNIDFSERQRGFVLIVKLKLYVSSLCLFMHLNYSLVFLLSPDVEARLCAGARDCLLRRKLAQLLFSCETPQPAG